MSSPNSDKSPQTDAIDGSSSVDETEVDETTSVEESVSKDNEVSLTAGKTQGNLAETQREETSDKLEFKTPERALNNQSSTRKSAIRQKKTDRKSLDEVKKLLNFEEESVDLTDK